MFFQYTTSMVFIMRIIKALGRPQVHLDKITNRLGSTRAKSHLENKIGGKSTPKENHQWGDFFSTFCSQYFKINLSLLLFLKLTLSGMLIPPVWQAFQHGACVGSTLSCQVSPENLPCHAMPCRFLAKKAIVQDLHGFPPLSSLPCPFLLLQQQRPPPPVQNPSILARIFVGNKAIPQP